MARPFGGPGSPTPASARNLFDGGWTDAVSQAITSFPALSRNEFTPWDAGSLPSPAGSMFPTIAGASGFSSGVVGMPTARSATWSGSGTGTAEDYKSRGVNASVAEALGRYNYNAMLQAQMNSQNQGGQGNIGGGGATGDFGNPSDPKYAAVNSWNNLIVQAQRTVAQNFGVNVPGNIIKAVMMLESQGVNVGCNAWGYCGLMQTGSGSNIVDYDPARNATPEGNIYYGVQELANWYNAIGTGNWIDAAAAYFSGYNYDNPNVSDGYGTTVGQYRSLIQQYAQAFAGTGSSGGGGGGYAGGASGALARMFPSGSPGHDFGVTSSNGLYGYGTEYGLNGVQHTGMDIPAPLGSTFYAPADATVVCVGCWRNDHITGGVGRIELEMPDGAHILYDHSNQSFVSVGQRVVGGQALGTNGGMYSPHTHLEVRVPDANTSSGWRLVDPDAYFAGYVGGGGYSQSGGYTPQPMNARQLAMQQLYGWWW